MKEKRVLSLFLILISLLLISIISAIDQKDIDASYECLKNKVGTNCDNTQNIERASFNLLALSYDSNYQSKCKSSLESKKNQNCWGETSSLSCSLKSTAQSIIALHNIDNAPDDSINWTLSKRDIKTGLTWFLEIDTVNSTQCEVNGRKIYIGENKKISGQDPAGLTKTYNSYWYEITNINKNYTISCEVDFITTLLYKKPGSSTLYVSSETHYGSKGDSTVELVNAYCFKTGNDCDYEGSLWSTLALARVGEDITPYLPYLTSMAEETANKKYMPLAFLCMITGADDYCGELANMQLQSKFWDESRRKLYDTSLALLALNKFNLGEVDNAKDYFIQVRDQDGCWGDDTSMILFSAWPKSPNSGGTGGSTLPPKCEDANFYCIASAQCEVQDQLDNYFCDMPYTCCNKEPKKQTCSEKGGFVCDTNQKCSAREEIAEDTNYCCMGACQENQQQNDCQEAGGTCKSSCSTEEQEKQGSYPCPNFGDLCCEKKPVTPKSSYKWLIILLLVILIVLIILAIIFRNQLRIWSFKMKSGFRSQKGPMQPSRPTPPPGGFRPAVPGQRPGMIRPPAHLYRGNIRRPMGRGEDKDYEETMRKLREMSK